MRGALYLRNGDLRLSMGAIAQPTTVIKHRRWIPDSGGLPKRNPVAGEVARFARQHTQITRKEPRDLRSLPHVLVPKQALICSFPVLVDSRRRIGQRVHVAFRDRSAVMYEGVCSGWGQNDTLRFVDCLGHSGDFDFGPSSRFVAAFFCEAGIECRW